LQEWRINTTYRSHVSSHVHHHTSLANSNTMLGVALLYEDLQRCLGNMSFRVHQHPSGVKRNRTRDSYLHFQSKFSCSTGARSTIRNPENKKQLTQLGIFTLTVHSDINGNYSGENYIDAFYHFFWLLLIGRAPVDTHGDGSRPSVQQNITGKTCYCIPYTSIQLNP
jgi:hypothetical protein